MINEFPKQKISTHKKTTKWAEDCINKSIAFNSLDSPKIRQSYLNKIINYNLANDILDQKDIERICNPFKIKGLGFPAKMQNYPVALPKIDLLIGEESKREFEWKLVVTNRDAVSEKDSEKRQLLTDVVNEQIKNPNASTEEEISKELERKLEYANYTFQDIREKKGTQILKYFWQKENFGKKFNEGFFDALIAGEENYCIDIENKEPILRKVNPLNLRAYRSGESPWLNDSDIIVEEAYYPVGKIIDKYYNHLKPKQIDAIESRNLGTANESSSLKIRNDNEPGIMPDGVIRNFSKDAIVYDLGDGEYASPNMANQQSFRSSYDFEGNILVARVVWKSFRKMGFLSYYDEETGEELQDIVSEEFKPNEDLGQTVEWKWLSEWWEGTKIGSGNDAIFVKVQRRPYQFRNPGNPSKTHSGYVGLAYNINTNKAMSLMDRMKPYQYLYNVLMYRTELAFAKSHGKIMRLPLHEIPKGWTVDKYLSFAFGYNIAVYDAFKEGTKGASMGKLAGNMQQNKHEIDLEMGSYIQQHIDMMSYIKEELGEISGVSKARQGQIHNRSAVGNVEREVTQSSHITEKWFAAHDLVKKKVMEVFLDTAVVALKNNPLKSQIVLGDFITEVFEVFPEDFDQTELGLHISNSGDDFELMQTLKQIGSQLVQSEQITFGEFASLFSSDSISQMTRKIEQASEKRRQQESEQQQAERDHVSQMAQEAQQWDSEKHYSELDMKKYEVDAKTMLEQMKLEKEGLLDPQERMVTLETLRQNQEKIDNAFRKDIAQLEETKRSNKKNEELKQKQISAAKQKKTT